MSYVIQMHCTNNVMQIAIFYTQPNAMIEIWWRRNFYFCL